MSARHVDRAIGQLLLDLVTPVPLEVALSVRAEMQARDDEIAALREQSVQRSREVAELAIVTVFGWFQLPGEKTSWNGETLAVAEFATARLTTTSPGAESCTV